MTLQVAFTLRRDGFLLDVAFEVPAKGVTALFGSSGSGKTTLLRCIAGLESVDNGLCKIGEEYWQKDAVSVPIHKRAVGYVFQEANLFEHLSVEKNLHYGLQRIPETEQKIPFTEAVELLGLNDLLQRKPAELSGGQRQRAAIARALLTSPKLLLMDEPLASLDLQSKAEILPYLEKLHNQLSIPVFYVSHSPEEIVQIADYMVLLDKGKIKAQGALNELLTCTDLPLAHLEEACAVVSGTVLEHDHDYHLSYVAIAGGKVALSLLPYPKGHSVQVRIVARDVSLALLPGQQSSITNVFPVRINSISPAHDKAKVLVKLDMGGEYLLSQITAKSAANLQLCPDKIIYAQVKSVALMHQ